TVFVAVGVSPQGQAHEPTLAQVCAGELGVPLERVVVLGGDTALIGFAHGAIASRVAANAGPAIARSAREVARRARIVAGEMLECAPGDVVLANGRAHVAGSPDREHHRSEEHTSELQSRSDLVCRLLLEKKKRG